MFGYFAVIMIIGFIVGIPCGMFYKLRDKKNIMFFVAIKPDPNLALKNKMFRHVESAAKERDSSNKFLDVTRDDKFKIYTMNLTDIREAEFYGN